MYYTAWYVNWMNCYWQGGGGNECINIINCVLHCMMMQMWINYYWQGCCFLHNSPPTCFCPETAWKRPSWSTLACPGKCLLRRRVSWTMARLALPRQKPLTSSPFPLPQMCGESVCLPTSCEWLSLWSYTGTLSLGITFKTKRKWSLLRGGWERFMRENKKMVIRERWSLISVAFHLGGLLSGWSLIRVVFH